jgi:hypothetical protein
VIEHHSDKGGTCPICELLDWIGDKLPPPEDIAALPLRKTGPRALTSRPDEVIRFAIGRIREKELPKDRVRRLGIKSEPIQKRPQGARRNVWPVRFYLWRNLDASLERDFDF